MKSLISLKSQLLLTILLGASLVRGQDHDHQSLASDLESLQAHIKKQVVMYPDDAYSKGIQGIVYVRFRIDSTGFIDKRSVKTAYRLHPACDRQAENAILSYDKKWSAASLHASFGTPLIQPVRFVIQESRVDFPSNTLVSPVKTIIIPKSGSSKNPAWSVYGKKGLKNTIGKIAPGDSVIVTGWAAWCYFIQGKDISGYVSRYALQYNAEMEYVAQMVEERSASEEILEAIPPKSDTVKSYFMETAHLSLTASKKSIYVGECTTVTLAFNVRDDNRSKLQFHDLANQFHQIVNTSLSKPEAFVSDNHITNIVGEATTINSRRYTTYKLYQSAYCPSQAESLRFPPTRLNMQIWEKRNEDISTVAEFSTLPLIVNVKPLPVTGITGYEQYSMVGKFTLEEKIDEKRLTAGNPFTYRLRIWGTGMIFPIEPPRPNHPSFQWALRGIHDNDTIINDVLYSEKTFIYQGIAEKTGRHDLAGMISFSFFNPSTAQKETIKSSLQIDMIKGDGNDLPKPPENNIFYTRDNFIIIDASTSMMIEDYRPHRLHAVKEGIKKFLPARTACDIGIITFGVDAHHFPPDRDTCYSASAIDDITFARSGTAIGDAIWLALISGKPGAGMKRIVVIGDGDNTTGVMSSQYAAGLAKKNNVRIYTIGIGNEGLVPFGRDALGRPNMIGNTFSDIDLKKIAQLTGGQYYHAQDTDEIGDFLKKIFGE